MIPKLKQDLPADVSIDVANDNSVFIDRSVKNVYHTIGEAIVLVALVIFVFLRTFRASIIPIITIPVSLVGTFALMAPVRLHHQHADLLALVLAIGLVVDDAIVMLENIFRHIEEGLDPFSAAIKGAREIGFAVITMTFTLVAVYAPLAFTPGRTGRLFVEFALALAGAVLVSGFIALTLTPMLCAKLLRHTEKHTWFDSHMERWLTALTAGYERACAGWSPRWQPAPGRGRPQGLLQARWLVVGVMLLCAAIAAGLADHEVGAVAAGRPRHHPGHDQRAGRRHAGLHRPLRQGAGAHRRPVPGVRPVFANLGNPSVSQGNVQYRAIDWDERKRSTLDIAREMAPKFNALPGVNAFPITPPSLGQGFRERPLNFVIQTSDSYENLNRVTRQMLDEIAKNPGIQSVDVDLRLNKPELRIDIDREKAADLGVGVDVVARPSKRCWAAAGDALQARRRAVRRDRADAAQRPHHARRHRRINVRGRNDTMMPLSALVKTRESVSPRELNHFGQRRAVAITANLAPDYSLGQALGS
jgi:multidrug efflux pump